MLQIVSTMSLPASSNVRIDQCQAITLGKLLKTTRSISFSSQHKCTIANKTYIAF
jgi:ribosome-associated protein YbcJ (S4-like RNA binding protein)